MLIKYLKVVGANSILFDMFMTILLVYITMRNKFVF